MKAQISKKLIKNFVNTHREKEATKPIKTRKDDTGSKAVKDNSVRKASNSKDKRHEGKRPKSSVDLSNVQKGSTSHMQKNVKNYSSPTGAMHEHGNQNTKVKVYKVEKDNIVESKSSEKVSKHLKSKSQVNTVLQSSGDTKSKQLKTVSTKKYDFYNQNFSSTDYSKYKKTQDTNAIYSSPSKSQDKSPAKAISNFHQQKRGSKKEGQLNTGRQGNTYHEKYEVSKDTEFCGINKYLNRLWLPLYSTTINGLSRTSLITHWWLRAGEADTLEGRTNPWVSQRFNAFLDKHEFTNEEKERLFEDVKNKHK